MKKIPRCQQENVVRQHVVSCTYLRLCFEVSNRLTTTDANRFHSTDINNTLVFNYSYTFANTQTRQNPIQ